MSVNTLKRNWLPIILVVVITFFMYTKRNPLEVVKETFGQASEESSKTKVNVAAAGPGAGSPTAHDDDEIEYGAVGANSNMDVPSCAQFVSSNLLPKDDPKLDNTFSEFSPAKDLQGQSFIDSNKYAIGMQSQTLRNANHQLRSDPPISNTMECSSPWNNTTIVAEQRRPLSIGSSA